MFLSNSYSSYLGIWNKVLWVDMAVKKLNGSQGMLDVFARDLCSVLVCVEKSVLVMLNVPRHHGSMAKVVLIGI